MRLRKKRSGLLPGYFEIIKDIFTKAEKYRLAGCPGILDLMEGKSDIRPYGFQQEFKTTDMTKPEPLRIFGGKLLIDFRHALQWIEEDRRYRNEDH